MLVRVLSVYKDTFRFFQKHLYVVILFFGINLLNFYFQFWEPINKSLRFLVNTFGWLLANFITVYMVAVVYKKLGVYTDSLSELFAVKRYYWKVALVFLVSGFILAIGIVPALFVFYSIVAIHPTQLNIFYFQAGIALIFGPFSIGLLVLPPRWLMNYDSGVFKAVKYGFMEFRKNILFYFLISLVGFLVAVSMFYLLYLGDGYNWIRAFVSSLSAAWFSVMYTFAFLYNVESPVAKEII